MEKNKKFDFNGGVFNCTLSLSLVNTSKYLYILYRCEAVRYNKLNRYLYPYLLNTNNTLRELLIVRRIHQIPPKVEYRLSNR
ncbi:hypothetical protein [Helicobacter ibis]|uniref:hypothetical protein n=1 Tax=Helicobacter ibis TaxID=2962633 RepID=UPI00387E55A9